MKHHLNFGSTLVEALVASSVLVIALAGIGATNWKAINILRVSKQETAATICLQERAEQMRNSTWANITSGTFIQTKLNTQPAAAPNIPGFAEEVTINAYPGATTAIDVTESAPGGAVINTDNSALGNGGFGSMVKLDVSVTWPNYFGPTHKRTVTTILSNGGIIQ